jgi:type II secretory pathway pseudopilin PulG
MLQKEQKNSQTNSAFLLIEATVAIIIISITIIALAKSNMALDNYLNLLIKQNHFEISINKMTYDSKNLNKTIKLLGCNKSYENHTLKIVVSNNIENNSTVCVKKIDIEDKKTNFKLFYYTNY